MSSLSCLSADAVALMSKTMSCSASFASDANSVYVCSAVARRMPKDTTPTTDAVRLKGSAIFFAG